MSEHIAPQVRAAGADDLTIAAPAAADTPHLPASIASFRVIRLIGAGGMGAVYEAEQAMPRRIVALKVIRPGLVAPDLRRRFENEVQVLGRLQHPGIAQIYQAGMTDLGGGPQPYFAMELVSGLPLVDYAERRGLGLRERLRLLAGICDAVQHAHQRGIIHRDLKPGNILVDDASGQPKILDFGIARTTDPDGAMTSHTLFGQIVGTLPYMSPEQLAADSGGIDTRSDVYALGVILYELLTGKLPHDLTQRSTLDAMNAIRDLEPARVGTLDRRLRGDVETIVAKALEKEKERRYASAAELAADIRRYLSDEPIVARPPSAGYQLRKFARRNKVLVGGVASAFLILIAGVVASTWQAVRATRAERLAGTRLVEADQARAVAQTRAVEATDARQLADQRRAEAEANFGLAEEARTRAEEQREANRQLLYVADMNLAQRVWHEGNYPRVLELLGRHRPAADVPDLRGFEWRHLWHAAHLHERVFELPTFVGAVYLSSDGQLMAAGDASGNVRIWDVATGRSQLTLKTPDRIASIALSPDRRTLAIGSRLRGITIVDAGTGAERARIVPGNTPLGGMAFVAGGQLLVTRGVPAKIWEVATGREVLNHQGAMLPIPEDRDAAVLLVGAPGDVRLWSPASERRLAIERPVGNAAVSDDGTHVAIATAAGEVTVWDVSGNRVASFQVDGSVRGDMVLSTGGRLLAGMTQSNFAVWNVAAGRIVATTPVPPGPNVDAAFSRDASLLLLGAENGVTVLDIAARRVRGIVKGHGGTVTRVATSSNDRLLVTWNSESVKTWDLSRALAVESWPGPASTVRALAVSPNGRWMGSTSHDQKATPESPRSVVALWDAQTGQRIGVRPVNAEVTALVFAGGRNLVAGDSAGNLTAVDLEGDAAQTPLGTHGAGIRSLAESSTGVRVASAGGNAVKVWDASGWRVIATFEHPRAEAAAFRPDDRHLVTAGQDGVVRVWTIDGRTPVRVLRGQNDVIFSVAWSPAGSFIASGDQGGVVMVWDAERGTIVTRLRAHAGPIRSLSFSPDGRRLLMGSRDGTVKLWDTITWSEVAQYETDPFVGVAGFALRGQAVAATSGPSILIRRAATR